MKIFESMVSRESLGIRAADWLQNARTILHFAKTVLRRKSVYRMAIAD